MFGVLVSKYFGWFLSNYLQVWLFDWLIICWSNKPFIFHEAVRLVNENTQTLINRLIEWIRLDTALKVSDALFLLPFSHLPCPLAMLLLPCLERAGSRRERSCLQKGSACLPWPRHQLVLASPTVPHRESLGMPWVLSKFTTKPTSGSLNFQQTQLLSMCP